MARIILVSPFSSSFILSHSFTCITISLHIRSVGITYYGVGHLMEYNYVSRCSVLYSDQSAFYAYVFFFTPHLVSSFLLFLSALLSHFVIQVSRVFTSLYHPKQSDNEYFRSRVCKWHLPGMPPLSFSLSLSLSPFSRSLLKIQKYKIIISHRFTG